MAWKYACLLIYGGPAYVGGLVRRFVQIREEDGTHLFDWLTCEFIVQFSLIKKKIIVGFKDKTPVGLNPRFTTDTSYLNLLAVALQLQISSFSLSQIMFATCSINY